MVVFKSDNYDGSASVDHFDIYFYCLTNIFTVRDILENQNCLNRGKVQS